MKRIIFALLFCLLGYASSAAFPVFYGYYQHKGEIYYGRLAFSDKEAAYERIKNEAIKLSVQDTIGFDYKKFNSDYYASDGKNIYYKGRVIEGLHAAEAEFLGGWWMPYARSEDGYVKDHAHVYFCGEKVDGADSNSFTVFLYSNLTAFDKRRTYRGTKPVKADLKEIRKAYQRMLSR